jgi:hypothetical protein
MQYTNPKDQHGADLAWLVKLAYLFVGGASIAYFLMVLRNGGSLAAAAAQASVGLLYGVAALILVFGLVIVGGSLRNPVVEAQQARSTIRPDARR